MSEPRELSAGEPEERGDDFPLGLLLTLLRRRWFFLAPFFTCGLLVFSLSHVLPMQYQSTAFIIVEQQKVPEQYVTPNVLMTLQKRLDSMTQQILSRTRLQRFIEDFGLYTSERRRMSIDDVIDLMRRRVSVQVVQTPGRQADVIGFKIHFSDADRYRAQQVTNELASLFIEQDARERTEQSQRTTAFLESQLLEAQKSLAEQEEKVRQYKLAHVGELPEQQQSNLQLLSSLEAQLHASTAALDRAEQQRVYLQSMRAQQEVVRSLPKSEDGPASANGASSLALAEKTLADLWKRLNEISGRLTDKHPDVLALKKEIADWESTAHRLKVAEAATAETDSRLKAIHLEIENEKRDSTEIRARIREVQFRLGQTPVREAEIAELTRHNDNARSHYQSLLQKKLNSELASNLEQRQAGEQFRLLDPANLPKKPEGRSKIVVIGWVLGAGLGLGLTLLREWSDRTIHRQSDLASHQWVPVLVSIPTVRSVREEWRRRLVRRFEYAAIAVMVLVSLATGAHVYLRG